jgi:hypothetical protein
MGIFYLVWVNKLEVLIVEGFQEAEYDIEAEKDVYCHVYSDSERGLKVWESHVERGQHTWKDNQTKMKDAIKWNILLHSD